MVEIVLLLIAGVAAGALNAVGGAGKFLALPALVAAGLPPATANASATVALVPGAVVGAWVYRREVVPVGTTSTTALTATSMVGGAIGAVLLLTLPSESFDVAVPWLLAFATLVLAFGRRASTLPGTAAGHAPRLGPRSVLIGQLVLAMYGGYFGGAVGILMMALWSVGLGMDVATSNPMRVRQLAAVYATATVLFLLGADVLAHPLPLLAMLLGGAAGGYGGARLVRRLPAGVLRGTVLVTAVTMTVLYFLRG
ncbi:hypothetical protein FHR81_000758 [Actinoalloteichus hoggarensis]|nr:sulfite exporter TauE/SafE family protein [Actinoalloteichus hoggarensis]MBB5919729.1 hypothetical protein [Actinoalloteichus hoggarensis]